MRPPRVAFGSSLGGSATRARGASLIALVVSVFVGACSSPESPSALYKRGMKAYRKDQVQGAAEALTEFVERSCWNATPDPGCRRAYVTLGHARERMGALGAAWAAYDNALHFAPHTKDAAVNADLDRIKTILADRNGAGGEQGPVVVRYKDEVSEELSPRSVVVSLDFQPVLTKEGNASELHGAEFVRVYSTSAVAGEHVLLVEAAHDCRPGGGVPCERTRLRKVWGFTSAAHTPTAIDIRAFTDSGGANGAVRAALDIAVH